MLEYLAYRKFKKNKSEKEARELARIEAEEHETASQADSSNGGIHHSKSTRKSKTNSKLHESPQPLLDQDDEAWLASILSQSDDAASRPALPMRNSEIMLDSESSSSRRHRPRRAATAHSIASVSSMSTTGGGPSLAPTAETATTARTMTAVKEKEKEKKSHNPISFILNRNKNKDKDKQLVHNPRRDPAAVVDPDEAARERDDLTQVLDDLNLGATKGNKAFALSSDNNELVRKFTLVLKDLVNGVPTAVDDLRNLIEDRDGTLKRNYDKLPDSMKKLVAQLPDKVTKGMGPDILNAAAEQNGIKRDGSRGADETLKDTAKSLFMPKNLNDIITKPGAVIGMLKSIVSFLKLRWPAFIGVNVVWSIAIFLLLLVLWYCHKRGREVRLERERSQQTVDGSGRIEELPDDPTLPAPGSRASSRHSMGYSSSSRRNSMPVSPASSYRSRTGRGSSRRERERERDVSPPLESPRRRRTHR